MGGKCRISGTQIDHYKIRAIVEISGPLGSNNALQKTVNFLKKKKKYKKMYLVKYHKIFKPFIEINLR